MKFFEKFKCIQSKICSLIPTTQGFSCYTLAEHRRFHTAIIVYRTLHQLSPLYSTDTFKCVTTVTLHIGRNSNRLFVPRVRTSYGKNSFLLLGYANLELFKCRHIHCDFSYNYINLFKMIMLIIVSCTYVAILYVV